MGIGNRSRQEGTFEDLLLGIALFLLLLSSIMVAIGSCAFLLLVVVALISFCF